MQIVYLFLCFVIFSFIGWSFESVMCSYYNDSHFINRGFFIGPYCPIYGFGGVFCFVCFSHISNVFILFVLAGLSCTVLEYLTSWILEKLLKAKLWDYSHLPFNINGRVCLYGTLLFAVLAVLTCKVIAPSLISFFGMINNVVIISAAAVTAVGMSIDVIWSFISWGNLNAHLKSVYRKTVDMTNDKMIQLSAGLNKMSGMKIDQVNNKIHIKTSDINLFLHKQELRFFNAFPKLKIIPYDDMIRKIDLKQYISRVFKRKSSDH